MQGRSTLVTVLIVVVFMVAAWWLVGWLFQAVWFLVRLAVVAVVALVLYVLVSRWLARRGD
ncbi:hypothetical protein [Georgenia sp. Z1491]|uniref:hypothetical protein n=1 Tax=Georgenia sp. Z1491 TaxID=3416707 RepID=UPI003CE718D3